MRLQGGGDVMTSEDISCTCSCTSNVRYVPPSGDECLLFLAAPRFAGFLKMQALEALSSALDITVTVVWSI